MLIVIDNNKRKIFKRGGNSKGNYSKLPFIEIYED
jgi:hypothetical protein